MNIVLIVTFLSGLAFFLFGMSMMGEGIERMAGNQMQSILGKLASTRFKGVMLGTLVTAIIQSSSATSVMAVSFVSSGIMTLSQAIAVVMGSNIGTTATGWLLTLASINGSSVLGDLLSTSFIFGVIAVIGIILYMFIKNATIKNIGLIMVSLSVLMTGMRSMSGALSYLESSEAFMSLITHASPWLCLLLGILITSIIQSSSASVGILQALSMTGLIPLSVAFPMVVGMSVGASVPVLISSFTANKDGKRTALSYLFFNLISGVVAMILFMVVLNSIKGTLFFGSTADSVSIAVINSVFKIFGVVILYPFVPQLEKLVRFSIKDDDEQSNVILLDEMLLNYPNQAIERSNLVLSQMANIAVENMNIAIEQLESYDQKKFEHLMKNEDLQDKYEDQLSQFLIKLNTKELALPETSLTAKYLRCVSDLERISDYTVNISNLAKQLHDTGKSFSPQAVNELKAYTEAIQEVMIFMRDSLVNNDLELAYHVKPLVRVVHSLTERLKQNHVYRMQRGECSLEMSFIFNDSLNSMDRAAGHCSNISLAIVELHDENINEPPYLHALKQEDGEEFKKDLAHYAKKYSDKIREANPTDDEMWKNYNTHQQSHKI